MAAGGCSCAGAGPGTRGNSPLPGGARGDRCSSEGTQLQNALFSPDVGK